jgi:hypothetical protein
MVVALLASCIVGAAASAEPGDLARQCIRAMHEVADRTVEDVARAAHLGARQIENLDGEDATDEQLRRAAHVAIGHVRAAAEEGTGRIVRIAEACAAELRDSGAPPAMVHAVLDAAHRQNARVRAASVRATSFVAEALRDALAD